MPRLLSSSPAVTDLCLETPRQRAPPSMHRPVWLVHRHMNKENSEPCHTIAKHAKVSAAGVRSNIFTLHRLGRRE